jgi:hypothetical protein
MTKPKTITIVLLCSKDNNLRSANIIFNNQIIDIQYFLPAEINWNENSTKESLQKYISAQNQNTNENVKYAIDGKHLS